jgi:biopolymer transport protein ExbD
MCLISLFTILFLFLFTACNEEKEFLTPKPGEIVLEVSIDEYSLNGKVLGKTSADILNVDDLLITPINNELRKIRNVEQEKALRKGVPADEGPEVRFHIDDNLSYDAFYKVFATFGFNGYTSIRYVIGSNFRELFSLHLPQRSNLSNVNLLDGRVKNKKLLIEHARRCIDLLLTVQRDGNNISYVVVLNETGLTDGKRLYSFEKEDDLWKYIEDIRLRRELQEKEDRDDITIVSKKDVLLKNIVPIIKKLTGYGYKIKFAISGS